MTAVDVDAPMQIQSLDDPYYFTNHGENMVAAVDNADTEGDGDLEFDAGDQLDLKVEDFYLYKIGSLKKKNFVPYHNGFRRGENMRNSKLGILPFYKTRRTYILANYTIFEKHH